MNEITCRWRVLLGGAAAATAAVLGIAGATTAAAEPAVPLPPAPGPVTVTQTVTVAPAANPAAPVAGANTGVTADAAALTPAAGSPAAVAPVAPAAPATAAPQTIVPAASGTITDFLKSKGVAMQPQVARDFRALRIVLPMPTGWSQVPDPNVPDAFAVIADRVGGDGLYTSNAQVTVYKLTGDFDPKEAISHGFIDSQSLPAWRTTDASLADFDGMPSSLIEGTYRQNNITLNTSRRHIIATAGADRYLVSLAVTTTVGQVVPTAGATDAIVNGFKVGLPDAAPAAPAPAPAAPAPAAVAGAPATTPAAVVSAPAAAVSAPVAPAVGVTG